MTSWRTVLLGEVSTIVSGIGFPIELQGKSSGRYPFAKVGDISKLARAGHSELRSADNYVDDDELTRLRGKPIPAGAVIFAKIGEAIRQNFRAITAVPCMVDNNVMAIIPHAGVLAPRYAYHLTRSLDFYHLASSTTVPSIRKSTLADLSILIPSMEEQRLIVEVLDTADELRSKRQQAIALLDDLARSIFLNMFGDPAINSAAWPEVALGDLLDGIDSGHSPKCLNRSAVEGEWGVLKLGAVTRCEYLPAENKALPREISPDTRHEVRAGDLLFSRKNTRELVAACAVARKTPPRLLLPDLIFRLNIRKDAPINRDYLHRLLIYPSKRRKVQELAGGSAGSMPNISKSKLLRHSIPLPPLEVQNSFSDQVLAIEQLRSNYREHLAELDTLFNSLQDRAFNGEL